MSEDDSAKEGHAGVRPPGLGPTGLPSALGLMAAICAILALLTHHSQRKLRARAVLAEAARTIEAEYVRFRPFIAE